MTPENYWAKYSQPDTGIHSAYPQPRKITEANFKAAIREAKSEKDKEIAELKEDNIRLRNAQEIGGNMYGHKLNEVSALHKQIESLTERLEAADQVITDLINSSDSTWEEKREGHDWAEAIEKARKYNSLKSKTK